MTSNSETEDEKSSLADLMEEVEMSRADRRKARRKERRESREERRDDRQEARLKRRETRQESRQERRESRDEARHNRIMSRIGSRTSRAEHGYDKQGSRLNRKERQEKFNDYFDALAKYGMSSFVESKKSVKTEGKEVDYSGSDYQFNTPYTPSSTSSNQKKSERERTLDEAVPKNHEAMRLAAINMIAEANVEELRLIAPKVLDDISFENLKNPNYLMERRSDIQAGLAKKNISPQDMKAIYKRLKNNTEKRESHLKRMQWIHDRLDQLSEQQLTALAKIADPNTPPKIIESLGKKQIFDWLHSDTSPGFKTDPLYFSFSIGEEAEKYVQLSLDANKIKPKMAKTTPPKPSEKGKPKEGIVDNPSESPSEFDEGGEYPSFGEATEALNEPETTPDESDSGSDEAGDELPGQTETDAPTEPSQEAIYTDESGENEGTPAAEIASTNDSQWLTFD